MKNFKLGKVFENMFGKKKGILPYPYTVERPNITTPKENTILKSNIPEEHKIKILSELYTFNHGNFGCGAFEYSMKAGGSRNGGGDFDALRQSLSSLGYSVQAIKYHDCLYRTLLQQQEYKERIDSGKPLPFDIVSITISDSNGQQITLFETPVTLEILALSGDERAIETYNNFMHKIGSPSGIINNKNPYVKK